METLEVLPPLIRQQGLRKRGSQNTGYASGHLSASAIHSVARRSVKASALFSARPTRSIGRSPTHTYKSQSAISATPLASLTNAEFNYTKVPAQSTKTSWYVSEYPV